MELLSPQELRSALDGLFAYDTGRADSGIKDEELRRRCLATINAMPSTPHELVPRVGVSRLVREMWLSEDALAQGYGIEDAIKFTGWLSEQLGAPLIY